MASKETVSNKTQSSLKRLQEGMHRVHSSIASINNDYVKEIELCALLTTVVQNLHVVSHFKHENFTAFCCVSHISTEFANVNFLRLLPSEEINLETESAMKEFVERYRPLRQRTAREEPTRYYPNYGF